MTKLPVILAAGLAAAVLARPASATGLEAAGWFTELGLAQHGTQTATVGLTWPWAWRTQLAGSEVSGYTEAYVSGWSARALGGGRQTLMQLGVVPVFRFRFDGGRSDWFAEAGIGVSVTSSVYHTPDKQFSTAGNFHDTLGFGRSFGEGRSQEIGLRIVHFSNASIKRPNPGIEFLQLRYARLF